MADAITIKALQDASLDAKSLEEVVNGNEAKQVTTRLGKTYPSVKKAINTMFENGGLPATPFATKALMTASALVNGKYAMVTDDTVVDNNGLYVKTAGAWVKSEYDPLAQSKSYTDAKAIEAHSYTDLRVSENRPDPLMPLRNEQSKKELDAFFGSYSNGLLIDPAQESEYQVLTVTNGKRVYESIDSKLGALFINPKIVLNKNGRYEWSRHNGSVRTNVLHTATGKTFISITPGAKSISGDNSAYLLTTTSGTEQCKVAQSFINDLNRRYLTTSVIVKALEGTTHAYLTSLPDNYALFDLINGTTGTVVGMENATITNLGYGYYRISASFYNDVSGAIYIGLSNNSTRVPTVSGLTAIIEQLQTNMGSVAQPYLENTAAATIRCLPTFDYRSGNKALLVEANRNFEGMYSDDLTQADWVKTGITVTLDATNIVNDPSSRLTANSVDATALQTITKTINLMSVFIKRVAGVGAISLTLDGGTNWQDITSQVTVGKYARVIIVGSGTSYGIKLSSANDVVDVCMFNPTNDYNEASPVPYGAYSGTAAIKPDSFVVRLASNSDNLLYYRIYVGGLKNVLNRFVPSSFGNGTSVTRTFGASDFGRLRHTVGSSVVDVGDSDAGSLIDVTMRSSATQNNYDASVNGIYAIQPKTTTPVIIDNLNINVGDSGNKSFEKLLLINEDINTYDISRFKYDAALVKSGDSITTTITKDKQFAGTTMMREPTLFVLSDNGNDVEMIVTHMNKLEAGYHNEAPARLMQRKINYNRSANEFTYITPTQVLYEHAGWSAGKGHTQSPTITRIKNGANAGRLVCIFTKADSDTLLNRNIYRMFNDSNGDADAWTTPEKIIDSMVSFGFHTTINAPDGSIVVFPSNHSTHPNRIITVVYYEGWFAPIYSDDNGATWQGGDRVSVPNADEPTISYQLDGALIVNQRTTNGGERIVHKSTDGGATWARLGSITDARVGQVSGSLVQLNSIADPNKTDDFRLVLSGSGRQGLFINKINPDLISIDSSISVIDNPRYVGYSSAKPILNNEYLAVSFEAGTSSVNFNSDNTSYLSVVKL